MGELREKLLRRAVRAEEAEAVIRRLREQGWLDDRKLAESYATSRLENEGVGKLRVLHDLRKRRVAPKLAERAVERAYQDTDETRLIEEYLRRKYRKTPLEAVLAEARGVAAVYRRLRAAGFRAASVLSVLRRLARDPQLLDPLEGAEED